MAGVQSLNKIKYRSGGGYVQIAGGFVGQQQPRIVDQGPRHGYALLFAAGEFPGPMVAAVFQAHFSQPVSCHCQKPRVGFWPRASSGIATFSCAVNSGSR